MNKPTEKQIQYDIHPLHTPRVVAKVHGQIRRVIERKIKKKIRS